MQITFPSFDEAEISALRECLGSGWVTQGPMVARFEKLIAEFHQVQHALATTSCTAALHLATAALQLSRGDEVLVPAFTWVTSAHCAEYMGARACFVDVDPNTFNLDPVALEAAITPRSRAIVAVHLFGLAAPMDEIMAIAKRHGLAVIEDAACAIGTRYQGKPIGGIGDFGCFSFHPRKVVTTGEGGMVTTNNAEYARRVQSLRNHGATGLPPVTEAEPHGPWTMARFEMLGFNLRLSDIQAAVGVAQMAKLETLLAERKAAAVHYSSMLENIDELAVPDTLALDGHTYQSYVVRVLKGGRVRRNRLMAALDAAGIQTRPGTHAVHRLDYYARKYELAPEAYPNAALCEDTTITLPIFPGMQERDRESVVACIRDGLVKSN